MRKKRKENIKWKEKFIINIKNMAKNTNIAKSNKLKNIYLFNIIYYYNLND